MGHRENEALRFKNGWFLASMPYETIQTEELVPKDDTLHMGGVNGQNDATDSQPSALSGTHYIGGSSEK